MGLFNFSEQPAEVKLHAPVEAKNLKWRDILANVDMQPEKKEQALIVHLDGYGFKWLLNK